MGYWRLAVVAVVFFDIKAPVTPLIAGITSIEVRCLQSSLAVPRPQITQLADDKHVTSSLRFSARFPINPNQETQKNTEKHRKTPVVFGWIDAESVGAPSGRDGMPPWVLYDFWQPFVTRL